MGRTHAAFKSPPKQLAIAAFWLGFALSGFFDGILLHQILQWHHLLSGLDGSSADFGFQIAADGHFHALMYLVAAAGLVMLWRAREAFADPRATRHMLAWMLIGFAVWHFVDAIASHWITQIHRVRMDAKNPLLWDLGWLALFGFGPLALGFYLKRKPPSETSGPSGVNVIAILAMITAGAGFWAAQRPPGQNHTAIVFSQGVSFDRGIKLADAIGDIVWYNGRGVFVVEDAEAAWSLLGRGAIYVSGAVAPAGCSAWTS